MKREFGKILFYFWSNLFLKGCIGYFFVTSLLIPYS